MKKYIIYTLAAGVLFLSFAACTKEKDNNEEQQNPEESTTLITEVLSATKEGDATKVTMTPGGKFGWSTSDKAAFSIYDGSTEYTFVESGNYVVDPGTFTVTYTGTRTGYAVIPSSFVNCEDPNTSYSGSTLTVTYPDTYNIKNDIADGCYNNADGAHFIPFPMVAASDAETDNGNITFFSIGALVRVVMSEIPVGTKNLYITFNQTVTGDFTVVNPGTATSYVAVSDAEKENPTPSTVTIEVSDSGLTTEQISACGGTITLYIPVPTTTDLYIASVGSANKKATVARNVGYSWTVDAITHPEGEGYGSIKTTTGTYIVAPGNLLAYKNPSTNKIEYSFLRGMNQLVSTRGNLDLAIPDPHRRDATESLPVANLNDLADGKYQDLFTWAQLGDIVGNTVNPGIGDFKTKDDYFTYDPNSVSVDGKDWRVPSLSIFTGLTNHSSSRDREESRHRRNGAMATVHGFTNVACAKVVVDVSGSPTYSGYGVYYGSDDENFTSVPGLLLFPDGYVDQTDALLSRVEDDSLDKNWHTLGNENTGRLSIMISTQKLEQMLNNGALFLPAVGMSGGTNYAFVTTDSNGSAAYYLYDEAYTTDLKDVYYKGMNITYLGLTMTSSRRATYYCSVRLVREVTP